MWLHRPTLSVDQVESELLRLPYRSGYFESSHLCPQRCSPTLRHPISRNSDRKFEHAMREHSRTIQINTSGYLSGRATSLGDRRQL